MEDDPNMNPKSESGITSVQLSGLSSYTSKALPDIGNVIQRERDRISITSNSPTDEEENMASTAIQYSTEGDHFNIHSSQDGGHAMLF